MKMLTPKAAYRATSFAEFISSASSREKKRVYAGVLKKIAQSQKDIIAAAAKADNLA